MIALDTNIISELLSPVPEPAVVDWLADQPPTTIFTTTVTEAEILYGLRLLQDGRHRRELEAAILPIFAQDLARRALPFDREAADVYRSIATERRKAGRPISQFDAQIAFITISRGAALATRCRLRGHRLGDRKPMAGSVRSADAVVDHFQRRRGTRLLRRRCYCSRDVI